MPKKFDVHVIIPELIESARQSFIYSSYSKIYGTVLTVIILNIFYNKINNYFR